MKFIASWLLSMCVSGPSCVWESRCWAEELPAQKCCIRVKITPNWAQMAQWNPEGHNHIGATPTLVWLISPKSAQGQQVIKKKINKNKPKQNNRKKRNRNKVNASYERAWLWAEHELGVSSYLRLCDRNRTYASIDGCPWASSQHTRKQRVQISGS